MVPIGKRLKELRAIKGVTQKQVAEYLEIIPNSFQQFEYDKVNPSLENIIKLCQYFQVPADYLLGLSDEPERR